MNQEFIELFFFPESIFFSLRKDFFFAKYELSGDISFFELRKIFIIVKTEYICSLIFLSVVRIEFLDFFKRNKNNIQYSFLLFVYIFRNTFKYIVNDMVVDFEGGSLYQLVGKHRRFCSNKLYRKRMKMSIRGLQ